MKIQQTFIVTEQLPTPVQESRRTTPGAEET